MGDFLCSYSSCFNTKTSNNFSIASRFAQGLLQADRQDLDEISQVVPGTDYYQLQHFVTQSPWPGDQLISEVAHAMDKQLQGAERLLILDEVGQPKKGDKSVGVGRQYCGNRGKVDNCQVSVAGFLTDFHQGSLIDMRLYLPHSWTDAPARMEAGGIPAELHTYRTKLEMADELISEQLTRGTRFDWVVADGFYGDLGLADRIDQQEKSFLLEVATTRKVYLKEPVLYLPEKKSNRGRPFSRKRPDKTDISLSDYYNSLTAKDFRKTRIRDTMKGNLVAQVHTCITWAWDKPNDRIVKLRLLIRKGKNKITFAFSNAFQVDEKHLLKVQAWRYFIERAFQEAKNVVGMKYYQVRKYRAWHHYMAMILLLLLFLMDQRKVLEKCLHPLVSYRDIKLCFQWFLPHKCNSSQDFIDRLLDNLTAKMLDFEKYQHHYP